MLSHRCNFVLFTFHTRYMRVVATHIRLSKEIHAKKLQKKTESYERRSPERRELNPGLESGRGLPAVSV